MKADILTENLKIGLSTVSKIVSHKNQLPILGNVLLEFKSAGLTITTTNLEISIKTQIKAVVEKEGKTTVPLKIFYDLISLVKEEKLKLILEKNNLIIVGKKTNHTLTTTAPDEFPQITKKEKTEILNIPQKTLTKILSQIVIATTQDETRPLLGGVLIAKNDSLLEFASTDGYRLSIKTYKTESQINEPLVVPVKTLIEVERIAKEQKASTVTINLYQENKLIEFIFQDTEIVSRLIEGDFPKIKKIIPPSFTTRIVANKEDFLDSIKTAAVFARESASIVKLICSESSVTVSANAPQIGESKTSFDVQRNGEDLEVAFNYRFLLDFLNAASSEQVVLETSGPLSPGVFKEEKDTTFLHIIMPVRVQS